MKNVLTIPFFLFSFVFSSAQEIIVSPVQPKAKLLTIFPFKQYTGGVMVIKACLGRSADSLNFILDTGSGGISLDSTTCERLEVPHQGTDTVITGLGGTHKVNFAFDQQLHLPGLTVDHLNFHINDYDILTSVYGEKVDGIIGYSFFSRYIVKINFDDNLVEVYQPGEMNYPRNGSLLHPVFTSLPIENIQFRDARKTDFNFYFDTGAGLCFLMSEQYATDSAVLMKKRKPLVTQAEGMGGKLQMRLTVIKQIKIGRFTFRKVPTYLYKDDYNVTSYPFVGGLIGNDLLRRFNLILNYPKREIHLLPNKHFSESFDYAYTGLAIYYVNGQIIVDDIIPGSPADKAGIKKGDIIISVANNISNNIIQYKTLLQNANQKIDVIISRNGVLEQLKLKTKTFIR